MTLEWIPRGAAPPRAGLVGLTMCLMGALGCGAPEGESPPTSSHCADFIVRYQDLPDSDRWLRGDALASGLWGDEEGLHLGWIGYRWYPEGTTGQYLDDTAPWLLVSTLDVEGRSIARHDRYRLVPDGITSYYESSVHWAAGTSGGLFAVGFAYAEDGDAPPRVGLGRLGEDQLFSNEKLPVDGDPVVIALPTTGA